MDFTTRIKIAATQLIFGKGKGKKQIDAYDCADHVNRSYNYLWKIADMNSEHPIPLEIIIPLMKLKNDYRLLELVAWDCGGVFVKLPKVRTNKSDDYDVAADFSFATSQAVTALNKVIKHPNQRNLEDCLEALRKCTAESVSTHHYIVKNKSRQIEMPL